MTSPLDGASRRDNGRRQSSSPVRRCRSRRPLQTDNASLNHATRAADNLASRHATTRQLLTNLNCPRGQFLREGHNNWGPQPMAQDSVEALFEAVDAAEPPARLLLASSGYDLVLAAHEQRLATWRAWERTSRSADPKQAA